MPSPSPTPPATRWTPSICRVQNQLWAAVRQQAGRGCFSPLTVPGIIPNAEIRAVQAAGNPQLPTLRGRVEAAHKGLVHVSELLEGVLTGPFHVLPPALAPLEEMRKNSPDPQVLQGRISWKKRSLGSI